MLDWLFPPAGSAPPAPRTPGIRHRRSRVGQKYWEEQGWKLRGQVLEGYYRTHYGSFKGRIELFRSGEHLFYIDNPPSQLQSHPHWVCFTHRGGRRYWIHFSLKPENVDAGIITIEKILCQAIERYH